MPATYMESQITSTLAWINVYLILDIFLVLFYWIGFYCTGQTGFINTGNNPGIPVFAWFFPYLIVIALLLVFNVSTSELLALPLFLLNFVALICAIIQTSII